MSIGLKSSLRVMVGVVGALACLSTPASGALNFYHGSICAQEFGGTPVVSSSGYWNSSPTSVLNTRCPMATNFFEGPWGASVKVSDANPAAEFCCTRFLNDNIGNATSTQTQCAGGNSNPGFTGIAHLNFSSVSTASGAELHMHCFIPPAASGSGARSRIASMYITDGA